jgi:hypothetical protein
LYVPEALLPLLLLAPPPVEAELELPLLHAATVNTAQPTTLKLMTPTDTRRKIAIASS